MLHHQKKASLQSFALNIYQRKRPPIKATIAARKPATMTDATLPASSGVLQHISGLSLRIERQRSASVALTESAKSNAIWQEMPSSNSTVSGLSIGSSSPQK